MRAVETAPGRAGRAVLGVLAVASGLTFLGLAVSSAVSYTWKQGFPLPSPLIALVAAAIVGGGSWAARKGRGSAHAFLDARWLPFALIALVAVLQAYLAWRIRFLGNYDQRVIYQAAWDLVHEGRLGDYATSYLSRYPNNRVLLTFEQGVLAALANFGVLTYGRGVAALNLVNVLTQAASAVGLTLLARRVAGPRRALAALGCHIALCGASPWFLVPYSDSLVICLPILIILAAGRGPGGAVAAGALSYLGFTLKPQIVFIALGLASVALLRARAGDWRRVLACAGGAGAGAAAAALALSLATGAVMARIPLDPAGSFTAAHYLMMGMNAETDGTFSDADSHFSREIADPRERTAADLARARDRVGAMGPAGLARHLARKQLVTWTDGTFGWKRDEGYFGEVMAEPAGGPARLYWSAIRYEGAASGVLTSVQQVTWASLLLMLAVSAARLARSPRRSPAELVAAAVAVLALMAFELVFEAGARYLYAFVPTMALIAVGGLGRDGDGTGVVA